MKRKEFLNLTQFVTCNFFKTKKTGDIIKYRGCGCVIKLSENIITDNRKKVLVVAGNSVIRLELLKKVFEKLKEQNTEYTIYTGIHNDPDIECVEKGVASYILNKCDCILAVGGGSVLDCAKMIALRISNPDKSIFQMTNPIMPLKKSIPLYIAPTTAGSGSEITMYAVITDNDSKKKLPILTDKFLPLCIALDPVLSVSLPPEITAYTGMDALTHAIEAYISTFSDTFYDDTKNAPSACRMIFENLPVACKDPFNKEARLNMLTASFKAGISFRYAGVGYVHSLSHRLGEMYGIPHGYANAVLLPEILKMYLPKIENKLSALACHCGFTTKKYIIRYNAELFINKIISLNKETGIKNKLPEINEKDFDEIIKRTQKEAKLLGCPVILSDEQIRTILINISN